MKAEGMRVILVTGSNGGLGQAIGREFIEENDRNFVWLGVHNNRAKCDALVEHFPDRCRVVELDVTSAEGWKRAVGMIVSEQGRVDVLVNNAGKFQDGLLATLPAEAWRSVLSQSLDGVFHGCQAVLPTMIAQRHGRIINVSSLSALLAPAGQANYAAAKAGVLALTQSLAKEVARIGITVNAVCPGYISTDALSALTEQDRKIAQERIPMRRFGQPKEVAVAVRFLACPEASYITGSILKVDGGIL
jgi:3-oxoacyl-[acyl-carrier protein] reductase